MEISESTVQKIREFAQTRQEAENEYANEPPSATALHVYARRLDGTLKELQEQFRRQEEELNKLREKQPHGPLDGNDDPWARVAQVRRAKAAYDALLQTNDELPATDSVLPSLLAIEECSRLIKDSKISVSVTAKKLSADREHLKVEEANLRDSRAIASGLRERIERIRKANVRKRMQTPSQVAHDLVSQRKREQKGLENASVDLKSSLDKFIDEFLAPMVAAEDLGGPTVGDALEVSDATLKAGYTASGRLKKTRQPVDDNDGTQQRIDQFICRNTDSSTPANKREAAARELHGLLDSLLEAGSSYVNLKRDSAASRFLVRAKVAQFHPRDARRIRIIDFGRSLGD